MEGAASTNCVVKKNPAVRELSPLARTLPLCDTALRSPFAVVAGFPRGRHSKTAQDVPRYRVSRTSRAFYTRLRYNRRIKNRRVRGRFNDILKSFARAWCRGGAEVWQERSGGQRGGDGRFVCSGLGWRCTAQGAPPLPLGSPPRQAPALRSSAARRSRATAARH